MGIRTFQGITPLLGARVYVDEAATVIGDVVLGDDVSVWPGTVIRGDVNFIRIGARSNIQDGSVVHCDSPRPGRPEGFPTIIGEDVLIGHMAMVHGCVLEDRAFVGLGAIVMDGCRIGSEGMLGAGAMLTGGKIIEPRQLWTGRPAKYMRDLTDAALAEMQFGVQGYVINGRIHAAALAGK